MPKTKESTNSVLTVTAPRHQVSRILKSSPRGDPKLTSCQLVPPINPRPLPIYILAQCNGVGLNFIVYILFFVYSLKPFTGSWCVIMKQSSTKIFLMHFMVECMLFTPILCNATSGFDIFRRCVTKCTSLGWLEPRFGPMSQVA